MPRQPKDTIAVLGIDIGKNTFHLIGLNKVGTIILRFKLSRRQLEARLANLPRKAHPEGRPRHLVTDRCRARSA
jgi:hypothetical protein